MFLLRSRFKCPSKCYLPLLNGYRLTHMSLRKKYIKNREKIKYVLTTAEKRENATATLHVIGSGAVDQPASVLINVNTQLYLFNCGEGIGRLCHASKINLRRIQNAFFTQSKWNCIGGVTSLIFMTVANYGFPPIFHGPNNLPKIFQRMIFLSSLGHHFKHRFGSNDDTYTLTKRYEDTNVVIQPIELKDLNDTTVVYLCKIRACRGKFSVEKTVTKNIPAGPLLAKLYRNEDVTLDDGTVVTAAEVRHPDIPEINILFIDIPETGFLKDLVANQTLKDVIEETKEKGIDYIVHFTTLDVYNMKEYQEFIQSINAKEHLVLNEQNKYASIETIYQLQHTLNKIDPKVHQPLGMKLDPDLQSSSTDNEINGIKSDNRNFSRKIVLSQNQSDKFEKEIEFKMGDEEHETEISDMNAALGVDCIADPIVYTLEAPPKLKDETFPRFLFLGTGAADSFLLRNSSGILVHTSKENSFLLDCGTGICSQINRFYGDEAPEMYRRIKGVFISHMHLDHHIGLPELFRFRRKYLPADREPLRVFCPIDDLKSWLFFYSNHVDPIQADIKFINNDSLVNGKLNYFDRYHLGIESMATCPVEHFRKSYAMSMTFAYQNGDKSEAFKLAYSGDTGPSEEFVKIGKNANLLVHEATFQNELKEMAQKYHHSTTALAIAHAQNMNAKHTILTHFGARYHVLPYINDELMYNMGIAFDFMEVTPNDFPRLKSLYDKYRDAFPHIQGSLEERTRNYKRRQNDAIKEFQPFE